MNKGILKGILMGCLLVLTVGCGVLPGNGASFSNEENGDAPTLGAVTKVTAQEEKKEDGLEAPPVADLGSTPILSSPPVMATPITIVQVENTPMTVVQVENTQDEGEEMHWVNTVSATAEAYPAEDDSEYVAVTNVSATYESKTEPSRVSNFSKICKVCL